MYRVDWNRPARTSGKLYFLFVCLTHQSVYEHSIYTCVITDLSTVVKSYCYQASQLCDSYKRGCLRLRTMFISSKLNPWL